jgi:hypothetical protein
MEFVTILAVLARHRLLVLLGTVGTVALGTAIFMQASFVPARLSGTPGVSSHVASTRLLLDARTESTLDLGSAVADSLGLRAGLLADLLTTVDAQGAIAREAQIRSDQLAIIGPAMGPPPLALPLAVHASEASRSASEPYVLTLATDPRVPIITLRASAPDTADAARLAAAAVANLSAIMESRRSRGPGLTLTRLGPITTSTTTAAPKRAIGIVVVFVAWAMWLVAIVIGAGLARWVRGARRAADSVPA